MKIWKNQHGCKSNEIVLITNSCTRLLIRNLDNGDLCFSIGNGILLKKNENDIRIFEINKTEKSVYDIFDKLYNSLLSLKDENNEMFDKDDNFIWFSNEEKSETSDYFIISRGLDNYKLSFVRNNSHKELEKKENTIRSININIFITGTKSDDIVRCFNEMYKGLNKIGTTELLFTKKDDKK